MDINNVETHTDLKCGKEEVGDTKTLTLRTLPKYEYIAETEHSTRYGQNRTSG